MGTATLLLLPLFVLTICVVSMVVVVVGVVIDDGDELLLILLFAVLLSDVGDTDDDSSTLTAGVRTATECIRELELLFGTVTVVVVVVTPAGLLCCNAAFVRDLAML